MIFGAHRQPLVARIKARPLGHRPAQQNAVQLQPQVVMQARGIMLLNEVGKSFARRGFLGRRLRRLAEIAFSFVLFEGHNRFEQRRS